MKPSLFFFTIATLALGACSSNLPRKVQSLNVAKGTTRPTTIIAPQKQTAFADFASRQSAFVESEVGNKTAAAISKVGRFSSTPGSAADGTITFESIRHGVTRVSNDLYAPIVEAKVRVVDENGKVLARRNQSATSGEIHPLSEFTKNNGLYRDAIGVAAEKLGLEIAGGL